MKKIIFTFLIGLLSFTFVQGQTDAGTKYLGGSFNLGFGSSKSSVDGTSADGPKTFSFGISPKVGYFLSDNLMVGLGIGYDSYSWKQEDGSDEQKQTSAMFNIGPFVRYYMMPTEKMGFFFEGTLDFGFGKDKEEDTFDGTTVTTEKKTSQFQFLVTPGVVFFVSEKVAFESTFGGLGFTSNTSKWTDDGVDYKNSSSSFGLELNPWLFSFGVALHF